jgi:hypothetical protein
MGSTDSIGQEKFAGCNVSVEQAVINKSNVITQAINCFIFSPYKNYGYKLKEKIIIVSLL